MGLFGISLWCFGLFCVAFAAECVPETARCSKYWEKTLPHKDLMASEDELNSWCRKQSLFYGCLEDVLLEGKNGNLSYLPTNLLISKLISEDLCSDDSKSRKRLLNNVDCINQLDTDFCILPEYLDIVTPDDAIPSTRCSQAEKTFSCIAATIVLNCGFDAARVYRTMLKITRYSDEVCGIEQSEGIPPCEDSRTKSADRNEKLSEIYYGLFHRIGNIMDQNEDLNENEGLPEEKDVAGNVDDVLKEALQSMLDNLDNNAVSEECDDPDCINSIRVDSRPACVENIMEYKPYMNPIITEVFREILFYNYSGKEFAVYWRQPEYTAFDSFKCANLVPSYMKVNVFRCFIGHRRSDPDCISNATVHEKVTPEFIRDFDPEVPCDSVAEFGPRPNFMKELDQWYEDRRIRNQMTSTESTVTEAPEILTTGSTLLHIASTMSSKDSEKKWYEFDLKASNMNSLIPNDIHLEMLDLLMPSLKNYKPPAMNEIRVNEGVYYVMYNSYLGEKLENITCSRIDECHPNGRGLWRCRIWPRKIETCDACEKIPPADTYSYGVQYARPIKRKYEALYTRQQVPESTTVEYEELETQTPSAESITVVSSDSTEYEEKSLEDFESASEPVNVLEYVNDEGYMVDDHKHAELKDIEMDFDLIPDSQMGEHVKLKMLSKTSNDGDSEVLYAIHDAEDDSEIILATENGLLAGKIVFVEDESDVEDKYIVTTPDAE